MNKKRGLFKEFEKFETHHKIMFFILVMILTIIFTRLIVFIHNPNPILLDFELHHFDYGLLLLIAVFLMSFFGPNRKNIYLILSGIALGLIVDDYWFIRKSVVENHQMQTIIYNSTFSLMLVSLIFVILLIFFINSLRKKKS